MLDGRFGISGAQATDVFLEALTRARPRVMRGHLQGKARRKFLRVFPAGFRDRTYADWEPRDGARTFAEGLYEFLHGRGNLERRFDAWVEAVAALPRRQRRVLTWPLVTVFGFIAKPDEHMFLEPRVTRAAAKAYGYDLQYRSRPSWDAVWVVREAAPGRP